jgi:hypothetical protein
MPDPSSILDAFPKGVILPWYVTSGSVPHGWAICDGTSSTPDLRGHFLIGVASMADVGTPFGAATHQHAVSFQSGDAFAAPDAFKIDDDRGCCPQVTGLAHKHNVSGTTADSSSIPPSVGVLFIMKVS